MGPMIRAIVGPAREAMAAVQAARDAVAGDRRQAFDQGRASPEPEAADRIAAAMAAWAVFLAELLVLLWLGWLYSRQDDNGESRGS